MRRVVAIVGAMALVLGVMGVLPAAATHCGPNDLASCPNPITVTITEGVGNVCSKGAGQIRDPEFYETLFNNANHPKEVRKITTSCKYLMNDPTWANKSVSQWNPNPAQGLYWVGLGPGGIGPTTLDITNAPSPPANMCVSNHGVGCAVHTEGMLTGGDTLDAAAMGATGAHCGSSHGRVSLKYVAADNSVTTLGWLEWDQSAGTILPLVGEAVRTLNRDGKTVPNPSGQRPSIIGFTSARGVGGAGNCGITEATTGFQVEGISVTF